MSADGNDAYDQLITIGSKVLTSPGYLNKGTVEFIGTTQFASGEWIGIELDSPNGKNNGSINNIQYFQTKEKYGLFVRRNQCKLLVDGNNSIISKDGDVNKIIRNNQDEDIIKSSKGDHSSYFREKLIELHEKAKRLNISKQNHVDSSLSTPITALDKAVQPLSFTPIPLNTVNSLEVNCSSNGRNISTNSPSKHRYPLLTTPFTTNKVLASYETPFARSNSSSGRLSNSSNNSNKKSNNNNSDCFKDVADKNMEKIIKENKFLNEQIKLQNKMIQNNNKKIENLQNKLLQSNAVIDITTNSNTLVIQELKQKIEELQGKLNDLDLELIHNNSNATTQTNCCFFC